MERTRSSRRTRTAGGARQEVREASSTVSGSEAKHFVSPLVRVTDATSRQDNSGREINKQCFLAELNMKKHVNETREHTRESINS